MPRLVFLEWDESELRVLDTRASKHAATAHQALSLQFPESDSGPGSLVAELIATANLGRADVVVLVGRSVCQLRTLTVPNSPTDELPGMVRFQAMRQYTSLSQDAPIDFVQLRQSAEHGIEVLAATISPELIEQIRQITRRANLNLKRVVLRPFATAALVSQTIGENDCALIVDQTSRETDLTVVVGPKVITTRTVRLSAETPAEQHADMLAAEIRRTMAVVDNLDLQAKVGQVVLLGNPADLEETAKRLAAAVELPVETLNPFSLPANHAHVKRQPEQPGRFASLLGAMSQHFAGETNRIDFLNPRRRVEDHSTKQRIAVYAPLAVLVLIGLAVAAYLPLRNMSNQIAQKERQISDEQPANKQANQYLSEVKIVDDWVQDEVVWLDELYYISYHLPPADRVIVGNMQFRYPPRSKNPTIVMTGRLKGSDTVTDLENALRDEQLSHVASSKNLKPIVDPEKRYDHEVDETITIEKAKLTKPKTRLASDPSTKQVETPPVPTAVKSGASASPEMQVESAADDKAQEVDGESKSDRRTTPTEDADSQEDREETSESLEERPSTTGLPKSRSSGGSDSERSSSTPRRGADAEEEDADEEDAEKATRKESVAESPKEDAAAQPSASKETDDEGSDDEVENFDDAKPRPADFDDFDDEPAPAEDGGDEGLDVPTEPDDLD